MKNKRIKSVLAVLAGFTVGAVLSVISDMILEKTGIMKTDPFTDNATGVVLIVLLYRFVYNIVGCYVAASLAPNRPMFHAMIIGVTGLVLGTIGSIVMWDQAVGWYNISVILISVPCAWLGARLYTSRMNGTTH